MKSLCYFLLATCQIVNLQIKLHTFAKKLTNEPHF